MSFLVGSTTVIDSNRKIQNQRSDTVEISGATTAITGRYYVATASLTLTLPASPTVGDIVGFQNSSGTETCVIARNSSNIMSLAENMTVDKLNAPIVLQYAGATRGWVFV
jgi:hypothetical protein